MYFFWAWMVIRATQSSLYDVTCYHCSALSTRRSEWSGTRLDLQRQPVPQEIGPVPCAHCKSTAVLLDTHRRSSEPFSRGGIRRAVWCAQQSKTFSAETVRRHAVVVSKGSMINCSTCCMSSRRYNVSEENQILATQMWSPWEIKGKGMVAVNRATVYKSRVSSR